MCLFTCVYVVANNVCRQIYRPFVVRDPYQSFLEMHSSIDNKQCANDAPTYIKTLSQDFCCTGAGGSSSTYIKCQSLNQQLSVKTTSWPTTRYVPSTNWPAYTSFRYMYSSGWKLTQILSHACVSFVYSGNPITNC